MARKIEGIIYRVNYHYSSPEYIECSSKTELFEYVARQSLQGYIVSTVNELERNGATPKVKVYTDKEYKAIYKRIEQEMKEKKPHKADNSIPDTEITEFCPHCDTEVTMNWDVEERGYVAFCPVCGKRMMLCSMCDGNCNWNAENDTCKMCRDENTENLK